MRPSLKQRIVTAVPLALALIAAASLLPRPALIIVLGAVVAVAAWEWSAMVGWRRPAARLGYAALAAAGMALLFAHAGAGPDAAPLFGPGGAETRPVAAPLFGRAGLDAELDLARVQSALGAAGLFWAVALLWVMCYPASARLWGHPAALAAMGALALLPPWLAVAYLLGHAHGRWLLLALVVVVAIADIGAYFAGKRFGQRKLAPRVSPGKSWEGFWGGFAACQAAALLAGAGWWLWLLQAQPPPEASLSFPGAPPAQPALSPQLKLQAIVACTSLASVLGDLVESMVKRHRGIKDSSGLLPGHGGVLDRIDGITAAAPVFALGLIMAGWLP